MKKILFVLALMAALGVPVVAQKIEKPTLVPKQCTEAQKQTIQEGVGLHDAKKFSDAVAKYVQVLTENSDCTMALYELSYTYYAMGDKTKAMETAYKGSKFKSDQLPLFYLTMANVLDDVGKPDEAVKIYRDAIKMLEGENGTARYLSTMHYNLGLTLTRQKKFSDARSELKRAVEYNYSYASPHYLLSVVYQDTMYKVPAFLAAARFISLELNSARTQRSALVIRDVLKPAPKNEKSGNISIVVDMNASKDEGDFTMFELFLGTLTTLRGEGDEKKSEDEMFADAVATLIALIAENKSLKPTFVGKNYVPFVSELKRRGYAPVLANIVLYHSGSTSARTWLAVNEAKLKEFVAWSKSYSLPK